jgi:hypothetical protein
VIKEFVTALFPPLLDMHGSLYFVPDDDLYFAVRSLTCKFIFFLKKV